jgi:RNA 3'-terminal phosphate cyclase (ATP)
MLRQHVTAVDAAAKICSAQTHGAAAGSKELSFSPGPVRHGSYTFTIGTAGSTMLVLQAILPALMLAGGESCIEVKGGTHAKGAPPFEFFSQSLAPLMERLGATVEPMLDRIGFYPAGGGAARVRIVPGASTGLQLHSRGQIRSRKVRVLLHRIPCDVAQRELGEVSRLLGWDASPQNIVMVEGALSPGNVISLTVECDHVTETCCAVGELGKNAERVAGDAIAMVRKYLSHDVAVGEYLADQLMVPMAAAWIRSGAASSFTTHALSRHATTNAQIIDQFIPGATRLQRDGAVARWSVG